MYGGVRIAKDLYFSINHVSADGVGSKHNWKFTRFGIT